MNPAQLEHLRAIDAHLTNLLAIAEKRTPGKWGIYNNGGFNPYPGIEAGHQSIVVFGEWEDDAGVRTGINDAAYIAACAGNAEAGWRATKAAIAMLLEMESQGCSFRYFPTVEDILAAWPLELLTLK